MVKLEENGKKVMSADDKEAIAFPAVEELHCIAHGTQKTRIPEWWST